NESAQCYFHSLFFCSYYFQWHHLKQCNQHSPERSAITHSERLQEFFLIILIPLVMRLSKPFFDVHLPVVCEESDIAGPVLIGNAKNGLEAFGVSEFLTLPHSFGYFEKKVCFS